MCYMKVIKLEGVIQKARVVWLCIILAVLSWQVS